MSDEITTAMVDTYNTGIEVLAQQMRSKLIGMVRVDAKPGKRESFDQIGAVGVRKKTVRHEDTKYINTPHRRRWCGLEDWEVADLLDKQDVIRILNNPGGEYTRVFLAAMNRQLDTTIIEGMFGTSYTGELGTTPITLPSEQIIVEGSTGFTLDKLTEAMEKFKTANAVEDDAELMVAWTAKQEREFLDTTEVKSIDYNTQKVLVDGGMGNGKFYGFRFVRLEDWTDEDGTLHRILPYDSGEETRSCAAWIRQGVLARLPMPPRARTDELPSKGYAQQFYASMSGGACRMQETHVIKIDCAEAAPA